MSWYISCWKKFATFSGRARRKEYWMFVLFNVIAYFIAGVLDGIFGGGIFAGLYGLAVLLPSLAVSIRRLHDSNHCAWWILIAFVPVVGGVWLLVLLLIDGSQGANRYGENPKSI